MTPELRKRIVTGVIGAAFLIGWILFLGAFGTAVLALVVSLLSLYEILKMSLSLPDRAEKQWTLLSIVWGVHFVSFITHGLEYSLWTASMVGLSLYFLFTARNHAEALETHFKEYLVCLFSLFYVGFLPLYLTQVQGEVQGSRWVILFFMIVFFGDTAAYFLGKSWGKRLLYPLISPKKTWEGAAGGMAASYVATLLAKLTFLSHMSWFFVVLGPVLVAAVAQLGDLCESLVKRSYHQKDSGDLLPGHGGFLDRFDGVFLSTPVMLFCIRLLA